MLKPGAQESDLRRWALGHFRPGDKKGKKKAVVGLARRIAVLLHMLWVNGEGYEPNYQQTSSKRRCGRRLEERNSSLRFPGFAKAPISGDCGNATGCGTGSAMSQSESRTTDCSTG